MTLSRAVAVCFAIGLAVPAAHAAQRPIGIYSSVMTTIARGDAEAGRQAEQAGDLARAAEAYSSAIAQLEPLAKDQRSVSWELYFVLGSAFLDRARVRMQSRIPQEPAVAKVLTEGLINLDLAKADENLRRAEALRPHPAGVADAPFALDFNLGVTNALQGNLAEGRAHLERAVANDPRRVDATRVIAQMKQAEKTPASNSEEKAKAWRGVVLAVLKLVVPKVGGLASALFDLGVAYNK